MPEQTSQSVGSLDIQLNGLHDVMHLIAQQPSFEGIVPTLLARACELSGSDAGFLVLSDEQQPHVFGIRHEQVPSLESLLPLVEKLPFGLYAGMPVPSPLEVEYTSAIVLTIPYDGKLAAIGMLLLPSLVEVDEMVLNRLNILCDALTIVVHRAMQSAYYLRLTQNQNQFVRLVSHDLRSPLTFMHGFASMLESDSVGELNERQSYYVGKIISGINQMTALVENIQDAGRYDPDTGFYDMQRQPTDLVDVVHRTVDSFAVVAQEHQLTMQVEATDDIPVVNVDLTMFERAIANLVDNAVKYTPDGGRIIARVRREQDMLTIVVEDNGYGIRPEHVSKLFKRHYRIQRREHRRIKGSGLGLFIVRSVAIRHGGDAGVTSEEGSGSRFFMRFPLAGDNLLGSNAAHISDLPVDE